MPLGDFGSQDNSLAEEGEGLGCGLVLLGLGRDNRRVFELRLVCVSGWLLVLLAMIKRSEGAAPTARGLGVGLCLTAIAADLSRWHVFLWQSTRKWLQQEEFYFARDLLKLGIGAGLLMAGFWFLRRLRRWPAGCGLRRGVIGVAGWLIWLLAWTAFLDDILPRAFGQPFLRFGIELLWAGLTAYFVMRSKEHSHE